jgi:hypothetical protein
LVHAVPVPRDVRSCKLLIAEPRYTRYPVTVPLGTVHDNATAFF